jgi:DnaJ-class molecular chaperone
MPLMNNPDNYGDLLIEFDVEYPLTLNADQKMLIKEALLAEPNGRKQSLQNQLRRKS